MTRTKKLTVSAAVSAICVVFLALSAVIPNMTLGLCALAGLFPAVAVICCGHLWALGAAAVAGTLALLLLPEKTAGLWFCLFFGHYPIWKSLAERCKSQILSWTIKLLGFLACGAALYLLFSAVFTAVLPSFVADSAWVLPMAAAGFIVCFVLYDLAFSRLIAWFVKKILPHIT